MNADKIKIALTRLHLAEAGNGGDRAKAYIVAITGSGLTADERRVLRNATHIKASEVGESE